MNPPSGPAVPELAPSEVLATLTLSADPRSSQQARAFLAATLADRLDADGRAVAALLVSELVTNSVVHAASEVEVACATDGVSVTVSVRDSDAGPLPVAELQAVDRAADGLAEGGRGLRIVDKLARAWGTEHGAGRKTVWFRLPAAGAGNRPGSGTDPVTGSDPVTGTDAVTGSDPVTGSGVPAGRSRGKDVRVGQRRLRSLLLPGSVRQQLGFHQHVAEILARVVEAVDGVGGDVRSGSGELVVRQGDHRGTRSDRYPLSLAGRPLGHLVIHFADVDAEERSPDDELHAFLSLAADRISLLALEHGLLGADEGRADALGQLSEATQLLVATRGVRECLALLARLVVPRMAQWAATYLVDERREVVPVSAEHVRTAAAEGVWRRLGSDPAVNLVLRDAVRLGRPSSVGLGGVAGERAAVTAVPLASRGRVLGLLVVGSPQPPDALTRASLLELGRRAALAVDNARLHDDLSTAAAALQSALLPPALPRVAGLDLAAHHHAAAGGLMVGGDFYDAFTLPDGSLVGVIGDVSGRGAPAAAVTGMARSLVRLLMRDGRSPAATLQRLNRALLEDGGTSRFCTVALARLERSGDEVCATVCLAGHPEPVLVRAGGGIELVGAPGDLLGVIEGELSLTEESVLLGPGDALVLYTDGVTGRRDGRRTFGQDGVRQALRGAAGGDAATLARALEGAARSFAGTEPRDDLAILVTRREP